VLQPRRRPGRGPSRAVPADEAVASPEIELTDEEVAALKASSTPREDFQGISYDAELAKLGIKPARTNRPWCVLTRFAVPRTPKGTLPGIQAAPRAARKGHRG